MTEAKNVLTMAAAKTDFNRGLLASYSIDRFPMDAGWAVRLSTKFSREWAVLVDARSGSPRRFRTLDAAVSALETIGFRVVSLSA